MQLCLPMKIPATAVALIAVAFASGSAHADGYIGAGLGSDSGLNGEISNHFVTGEEAGSSRIFIGQRFGSLGLEANLFGTELTGASDLVGRQGYSTLSLGVDLRYFIGLAGPLEAFVKAGLNKTWLDAPSNRPGFDFSGRGHEFGAGLQLTLGLPMTDLGIWLDYTRHTTKLRDRDRIDSLDGRVDMMTIGASLTF